MDSAPLTVASTEDTRVTFLEILNGFDGRDFTFQLRLTTYFFFKLMNKMALPQV